MKETDVVAKLAAHPLLTGVDERGRGAIRAAGIVDTYASDDWLSREGDEAAHYWLLLSGSVKVTYTSPDGFEVIVKVFHAPAAWAEMEVLTGQAHIENCVCVDKATVLKLPRARFEHVMDEHPRFMKNVLYDTCARFFIAAQNERALAFLPVPQRLANLLLAYLRIYGVPVDGGTAIRVKLTQSDLAAGLGAAKKSITRTLTEWKERGIVEQRGNTFVVTNVEELEARSSRDLVGVDWIAGRRVDEGRGLKRRV